jgi:hypothetical protein
VADDVTFYLSLFVIPLLMPVFPCFYERIASRGGNYILSTRVISMPLLILIFGLEISNSRFSIPEICKIHHMPGLHFSVDCHIHLPVTYMVFSTIRFLPSFILLFKNCHKNYAMKILMNEHTCMDLFCYALLLLFILLVALLAEPHWIIPMDGMLLYKQVQSTRLDLGVTCAVLYAYSSYYAPLSRSQLSQLLGNIPTLLWCGLLSSS